MKEATRGCHPARTNPADLDRAALILQVVCAHFHCSSSQLEDRDPQATRYLWPRFVAVRLIKDHTDMSLSTIGALFNRSLPEIFDLIENPRPGPDWKLDELCFIESRVKLLLPNIE